MKPQWTIWEPQQTETIKEHKETKKAEVEKAKEINPIPTLAPPL
jgi:hypothetical protein